MTGFSTVNPVIIGKLTLHYDALDARSVRITFHDGGVIGDIKEKADDA